MEEVPGASSTMRDCRINEELAHCALRPLDLLERSEALIEHLGECLQMFFGVLLADTMGLASRGGRSGPAVANVFNGRYDERSAFDHLFANPWPSTPIGVAVVLQLSVAHVPVLQPAFSTVDLT